MPLPRSERALRRAVADLAGSSSEDIEAVLDELEPRQRQVVRVLLGELIAPAQAADCVPAEDTAAVGRRIGVSPWLLMCVGGEPPPRGLDLRGDPTGAGVQPLFAPTPTAADALRASVLEAASGEEPGPRAAGLMWWRLLRRGLPAMAAAE